MIRNPARFVQNKFWTICFAVVLPLGLVGCGSTSGESLLSDSVSLTSPSVDTQKNALTLPKADTETVAEAKKTTITAKPEKIVGVAVAKEDRPQIPSRRPYRKQRARLASTGTALKGKDAAKLVTKQSTRMPAKSVAQKPQMKKIVATVKPTVKNLKKLAVKPVAVPVIAEKPEVAMVPMQVIPVQIMPQDAPQDIMDAFNETPQEQEQEPEPEKMAKAETPAVKGGFGQADHRFSGQ